MQEYINKKTGETVSRAKPSDEEFSYTGKNLILETDMEGYVTYANKRFVETSGYDKKEIIGLPHCIHMHPDMPTDIFRDACKITSSGKTWNGYIKNIAKDGSAYWTETSIQPKFAEDNTIIGFMAIRREPDSSELPKVQAEYKSLNHSENKGQKSQYCGEVYLGRSCNF